VRRAFSPVLACACLILGTLCARPAAAGAAADAPAIEGELAAQMQSLLQEHAARIGDAARTRIGRTPTAAPRVVVQVGRLDPRLRLAPCERMEPRLPQGPLWGRTRVGLRCVQGQRPWQVWLPVTVQVHAPALVAARALPAGTVLAAADLRLVEVDWAAAAQPPTAQPAELLGRTLSRPLQPGQAVRRDDLRQRRWFAAGETVQVLARGAGFTVVGEALALGPGFEGKPVRLRTEAGRILSALPMGERRAEIEL